MEFYLNDDYRDCIRWGLERLKSRGERATLTSLATAARVQAPYLSKVLSGRADLNEDQLYLIAQRLKLSAEETEYLSLLLHFSRAQLRERQDLLRAKIDEIRLTKSSPAEQRSADRLTVTSDALSKYYLNPLMQVVHMHLMIPKWREAPDQLAQRLNLDPSRMSEVLASLEELGIIELKAGKYKVLKDQLHLGKSSPLCEPNQTLMKVAGLERMRLVGSKKAHTFVATFSANEKARKEIVHAFSTFLKTVEKIVDDAPADEVYQVNFDLFPWL